MATAPKPRSQSMYHLHRRSSSSHHSQDDIDPDAEFRRQQALKINAASVLTTGKTSFDWLWQKSGFLGTWMNKQAGKMGMEAFWPTSLDKECDKCARILYTFTQRGLDPSTTVHSTLNDPHADRKTQRVMKKIPKHVIQQAEGLAIFTVFRSGLGWSAASGSGIVISRDSPTTWGPPSGILIHTIGVGFLAGIDVYDAVLVLRTQKAVMSFAKPKVSIGAELAVVAGPVGNGVTFESGPEVSPVFAYTKSKGIYGGLQLDGNIIIERNDENARFYGRKIKAEQILRGGAVAVPRAASGLIASIDAAEGKPVDAEEFPAEIDVAPSEQSEGVSNIHQSREKAALESGLSVEAAPGGSTVSLTTPNHLDKRRSLPPLPYHAEQSLSGGVNRLQSTAEVDEEAIISTRPPVLPPRRRFSSRHTPQASLDSLPAAGSLSSSSGPSTGPQASLVSTVPTDIGPMPLLNGSITGSDKPPEPFQLHSRTASQVSDSIAIPKTAEEPVLFHSCATSEVSDSIKVPSLAESDASNLITISKTVPTDQSNLITASETTECDLDVEPGVVRPSLDLTVEGSGMAF